MALAHGTTSARDTLPHLLARGGLRLTGPRRAVLDVLASSRQPLTVAEIHQHLGGSRAHVVSVYRTVHLLVRLRLVRPTDSVRPTDAARGSRRYELAEQFTGHHHHLICQGCGRIEDLEGCVVAETALTQLTRFARRTRRFVVTEHEVRLFGLCHRCAGRGGVA
jgi:Fur family transcriptional regulator, ferric uptake regulator